MESAKLKILKSKFPDREYPSALGMVWTNEEENQLLKELEENVSIKDISIKHNRTIGGINSRINHIAYRMYTLNIEVNEISNKTKLNKKQIMCIVNKRDNKNITDNLTEKSDTNIFDFLQEHNEQNKQLLYKDDKSLNKDDESLNKDIESLNKSIHLLNENTQLKKDNKISNKNTKLLNKELLNKDIFELKDQIKIINQNIEKIFNILNIK